MVTYVVGNILDSKAQALINTVNTDGVMGKGIALQFKKAFVNNFKAYQEACKNKKIGIGKLFIFKDSNISNGEKIIINFPTKTTWRKPSEYEYIEKGLDDLIRVIQEENIKSIAIPPLGAGNGGLEWEKVKKTILDKLHGLDMEILIYEPSEKIKDHLKTERIKLTDARALLLFVLYDLVRNGEYVSEFSSEKVCYFLQRFGAEKYFNLKFVPNFYGPYSGKVKYVLNILNGSYLMGYSGMSTKPFEPISIVSDGVEEVNNYVSNNPELARIAKSTTEFLTGYYSDFTLELLSSLDYLSQKHETSEALFLKNKLDEWSDRKRSLFADEKYIGLSLQHLKNLPSAVTSN